LAQLAQAYPAPRASPPLIGGPRLSAPSRARSLSPSPSRCPVGLICWRQLFSHARPILSLSHGPRSLARPPVRSPALADSWALPIRPALFLCNGRAHGVRPRRQTHAHVARALGKDPAHSPSPPMPHIRAPTTSHSPSRSAASPRFRFVVLPSPLDFCQHFGHGELHLSLVHQEPAVVSPFLNSTAWSALILFPTQVGARRRRDSLTTGQPEPPRAVPSRPSAVSG
jgi:hypothetical protein